MRVPAPASTASLRRVLREPPCSAGGTTLRNYRAPDGNEGPVPPAPPRLRAGGTPVSPVPDPYRTHRLWRPIGLLLPRVPGPRVRRAGRRPVTRFRTLGTAAAAQAPFALLLAHTLVAQAPAPDPPVPGTQLPVVIHTLGNGMTFLILERRQSPTVALVVHYPVGSVNERLGNTGIAHVVEHMLFKGSEEIGTSNRGLELPLMAAIDAVRDSMVAEMGRPRPTRLPSGAWRAQSRRWRTRPAPT